jgi:DNA-directed RNA polymerase subunit RPC12/RpoP
MWEQTLDGHVGRPVTIDICLPCQSFWFDARESLALSPGGTLALFRLIGEQAGKRSFSNADLARCPRCKARLRLTQDMQRTTRFSYLRCPNDHGRLTTFLDFRREKDFLRPLTPVQLQELRQNVQTVNCSNCGAPVDVTHTAACGHCGSPLSMLDLHQAETLVAQLQKADARERQPIDPALPLELLRARRQVEAAFPQDRGVDWSPTDLVDAGLQAVASWLKRNA